MNNFSNPQSVLESIVIGSASVVADLGCGSGHYSIAAAKIVGPEGRVYAVDVQEDLLERLKESAQENRLQNIEIIHADIEMPQGTKIQDGVVDMVMLCNTLFQTEDKRAVLHESVRILRPSGRILVVDWSDSHSGIGPDSALVYSQESLKVALQQIGFSIEKEIDAGEHHYGVLARTQ